MEENLELAVEAKVICISCHRVVKAVVELIENKWKVVPGQKCKRCKSSLDACRCIRQLATDIELEIEELLK